MCRARFVYTPAAGTVLNAGVGQTLSVTFTPTDTANYTTATASVSITVAEGDAGDHVGDPGRHHLRHGAERDAAECDRQRAGHVRLHAGGGTVLNAGVGQTLSVTFTPTDAANYTTATAAVSITVTRRRRRSRGRTPAAITYGTALSATQLNATASVPGTSSTRRQRDGAQRGRGADAVGDVHADRRGELQHRDRERVDHGEEGDAGDYVDGARGDHLRHAR